MVYNVWHGFGDSYCKYRVFIGVFLEFSITETEFGREIAVQPAFQARPGHRPFPWPFADVGNAHLDWGPGFQVLVSSFPLPTLPLKVDIELQR